MNVAKVYQLCWLEERGQLLKNVNRSHLVLAKGNPVQQKASVDKHNKQFLC